MAGNVKEFNEQNFQVEVLDSTQPVLVDFWAEWCGPCKQLMPTIDELANDYSGKVVIGKVNVDENQSLAMNYGIRGIPNLLIFKEGKVQKQIVGNVAKSELESALDELI